MYGKNEKKIFASYPIFVCLAVFIALLMSLFSQKTPSEIPLNKDPLTFYSEKVTAIVQKENPTAALTYVENEIQTNQEMMKLCHPLVHLIGHLAYKKYDFATAISYQDDICGSGYIHGVIEEKFSSVDDPVKEMQTICATVPPDEEADCYHGVGHGLMYYTENDIPEAIRMCQTYQDFTSVVRCSEGVYMENFSTTKESLHSTQYLSESDPFYPCGEQPATLKNVCYFYSSIYYLHLHPGQYADGLTNCLNAEKNYQYACAKGMGSRLMKENLTNISFDESVCDQSPASLQTACVEGLTSYHLTNFDSQSKTQEMCKQLKENHQQVCLQYLSQRAMNFGE